jgi:hypothetical protein
MVIILLILNGNSDLWLFIACSAANWSVMMFGLVQEQLSYLRRRAEAPNSLAPSGLLAHASAHFLGWVPLIFVWTIIIAQFWWGTAAAGDRVPDAVRAIIWVQLVMFSSFGINHLAGTFAHLYGFRTRWSYLHTEITYTILSFVAKSLLAWILSIGVSMRDPEKLVPLSLC